jgi:pSer/pThr/pTyr-binding forkhead associated (FHA) protein
MAQPNRCGRCGAALEAGFRFCGMCGMPAGASPAAGAPAAAPASVTAPPPVPAAAPPRIRLTLLRSDGSAGQEVNVPGAEAIVGRAEGAIRLADDATVSPRHARFTVAEGALRVEDLGSVNGTFLRLRAPRRISVGDELRLGAQLLRVEPLPRPAPADAHAAARAWGTRDPGYRYRLSQLLEGGGLGEIFPLREGANVIGREAGEITFPSDRWVSARHARIEVAGAELTLADAGSANGTFVKLTAPAELVRGDELLVGGRILRVE